MVRYGMPRPLCRTTDAALENARRVRAGSRTRVGFAVPSRQPSLPQLRHLPDEELQRLRGCALHGHTSRCRTRRVRAVALTVKRTPAGLNADTVNEPGSIVVAVASTGQGIRVIGIPLNPLGLTCTVAPQSEEIRRPLNK